MNKSLLVAGFIFLLGSGVIYTFLFHQAHNNCQQKGGVLVTSPLWYECVQPVSR